MTRIDARLMLAFGFAVVALSNWLMTWLTKDWEFWQLFLPQVLRGFGMMFAIVPITNISLGTLAPGLAEERVGAVQPHAQSRRRRRPRRASTLSSISASICTWRGCTNSINWARRPVVEALNNFAARMPGSNTQNMALKQLFLFVRQQATVMAFADVFLLLCLLFAGFAALVWLMRRPPKIGAAATDAH